MGEWAVVLWSHMARWSRVGSLHLGHTAVQHPIRDSEPDKGEAVLGENQERGGQRKDECRKETAEMENMGGAGENQP